MNKQLDAIVKAIAEDAVMAARLVMDRQGIGSDDEMSSDLTSDIDLSENPIINLLFNNYLTDIESGRKPGGDPPPISALRDWALRKGLSLDNGILYAIAQSIARDGIQPRPIMVNVIKELEQKFNSSWANTLFEYIVGQVSDLFVD